MTGQTDAQAAEAAKAERDAESKDARTRKSEHDRQQADLPGSISSDDSPATGGARDRAAERRSTKKEREIEEQRAETQKVYAQVARDAEELHDKSIEEAEKAQKEVPTVQPWRLLDEPLPGEQPPYTTARDEEEKAARKAERREDRDERRDERRDKPETKPVAK